MSSAGTGSGSASGKRHGSEIGPDWVSGAGEVSRAGPDWGRDILYPQERGGGTVDSSAGPDRITFRAREDGVYGHA